MKGAGPGLRALLVDLDGTLVDSLPALRKAYDRFLGARGVRGSDAEFQRWNGPPLTEIVAGLAQTHGLSGSLAELLAAYHHEVETAYVEAAPLAPGAMTLFERAEALGAAVAVVTSAPHGLVEALLRARGIRDRVQVLVGGDDVTEGKPAPEPYLAALDALGIAAARAIAIEDSPSGTRSAVAAGLRCLGVGARARACVLAGGIAALPDLEAAAGVISALERGPGRVVRAVRVRAKTIPDDEILDESTATRVAEHWSAAIAERPERVDGEILSVRRWSASGSTVELEVTRARYRSFLAQRRDVQLGLVALGVSGVAMLRDGRLVLGRRAPHMTQYPGAWEAVPSGGVSASRAGSDGAIDLEGQLREELEEELAIPPRRTIAIRPLGLIEDLVERVVDVCYAIDIDANEAMLREGIARHGEYDAVEIVSRGELLRLAAQGERPLVPVTAAIVRELL